MVCMKRLQQYFKPAFLAGGFGLFLVALYYIGAFEYFKWSVWKEIHMDFKDFALTHPIKSFLIAIFFYLIAILTFLPGMLLFDLVVGYLFPQALGVLVITTGSTLGALVIVAACRFGFRRYFAKEDNALLGKIKDGFSKNEILYLLFLRFVPFFPFALVSVAVSSLPISYRKVAWTTFLGMIPVAFITTTVGRSFGELMKLDHMPAFSEIVSTTMIVALSGLCFLSLLPVIFKRFLKRS